MITIIGGGPVGCFAANLLAKHYDVQVFEEHRKIGSPVQCTGIVTREIERIIDLKKEFVINRMDGVKIFSKNNFTSINLREIVLDRERFDNYMAKKAISNDVKINTNCKFLAFDKKGSVKIRDRNNNKIKNIKTDILIGADGPLSPVAQSAGLFGRRDYYFGLQARVKMKNDNSYQTYFGSICPGFFAWIVPEDRNTARVGLATKENAGRYFDNFLKKVNYKKIISRQAGLIHIHNHKQRINEGNIYLVGDAAGQVKATTGGGIVPGLLSAKILADCIINRKDYQKEFRDNIGRELYIHLRLRKILNRFTDKDYNYLIKLINQEKIKKVLHDYSRDVPSKILLRVILKEPRFLRFFTKMF